MRPKALRDFATARTGIAATVHRGAARRNLRVHTAGREKIRGGKSGKPLD
jgi:hypothetical protein